MSSITIIAVGKIHEPHVAPAITLYEERLKRFCKLRWQLLPHAGSSEPQKARQLESANISQRFQPGDTIVLLDERGRQWSSPQFATQLNRWQAHSSGRLVFVIGGAYGVDATLREHTHALWSLSPLVFPHQLVRVLLLEQLYRAYAINNNLPYHHS